MICYRVYGLVFRSDCELPGLVPIQDTSAVDYSLILDSSTDQFEKLRRDFDAPCYISSRHVKSGRAVVEVCKAEGGRKLLFRYYDGIDFIVDRWNKEIWAGGLKEATSQAALHHFLFSLPGFLLVARGSVCLHGAAVGRGERAIALLGGSNSGKSVLCAHLAMQGLEVLSDDLVALDVVGGVVTAHAGYPWISLRLEGLDCLGVENGSRVGPVWHYMDETYVTWTLRPTADSVRSPKKLDAVYFLTPAETANGEPAIEPVEWHRALPGLMEAARRTHVPIPELAAQEFSCLGSVLAAVPTYELRYRLSSDSLAPLSRFLMKAPGLMSGCREQATT